VIGWCDSWVPCGLERRLAVWLYVTKKGVTTMTDGIGDGRKTRPMYRLCWRYWAFLR